MKPLRQAIDDYIRLRRSLGFKLRDMADDLQKFAAFMEQKAAPYVTTELAMEWAMQPSHHQPSSWAQRLGFVRVFARHWHATDPRTEIPPPGLLPFRPQRARPYLYSEREIQKLLAAALKLSPRQGLRPSDIPLPVWAVGGGRFAYQRGAQAGAAGCGSRRGHSHHPSNKVRQDPPGSAPHFHSGRHGRLRPAPRPVSAQPIVSLFLSQRSWPPSGRLCGSSNIL